MPTKQLKAWAEEAGKTVKEAEKCWENAKKKAHHAYPKGEEDPNFWSYVNIRTRQCLGLYSAEKKKPEMKSKKK